MPDTDILIRCPFCSSLDLVEQKAIYATTMKVEKPGDPPKDVKLMVFLCCQCGRRFNEMEGRR